MDDSVNNLENSQIENSQNSYKAKSSSNPEHHKNAKLVLVVLFIILVIAIIVLSVFLVQEKSNNKIIINEVSQSNQENISSEIEYTSEKSLETPEGYQIYRGESYSFYYPIDWGDPIVVETLASDFIGERFYNQNVKYNLEGNYWEYVEDQGFDGEGYAWDVQVLRKSKDITVWGFGFGDAGCGKSDPTYLVGNKIIQITMPVVCAYEDSVSGTFVEGEVEINLSQDNKIKMNTDDYNYTEDAILDSIVLDAAGKL
jgi:hypothetical protein